MPALLGAGALAGNGRRSLTATIAITVVASLGADLTWYALGRWWGPRLLNVFGQDPVARYFLFHRARRRAANRLVSR